MASQIILKYPHLSDAAITSTNVLQGGSMSKIQHLRLFFLEMGAQTPPPPPS
jgi:hypothetical protein